MPWWTRTAWWERFTRYDDDDDDAVSVSERDDDDDDEDDDGDGDDDDRLNLISTAETDEDNAVSIDVIGDLPQDDDPYVIASFDETSTSGATVTQAGGSLIYDPGDLFQFLAVGETVTDTFTYTVGEQDDDEIEDPVTETVTVTITGVNDDPEITGGDTAGAVSEDDVLLATGTLAASDVDTGDTLSWSVDGDGVGTYGSLTIDDNGTWTYVLDNESEAVQGLNTGDLVTDSFQVIVADGNGGSATETVVVNIAGEDDASSVVMDFDSGVNTNVTGGSGFYQEDGFTLDWSALIAKDGVAQRVVNPVADSGFDGDPDAEFGLALRADEFINFANVGFGGQLTRDGGGDFSLTDFDLDPYVFGLGIPARIPSGFSLTSVEDNVETRASNVLGSGNIDNWEIEILDIVTGQSTVNQATLADVKTLFVDVPYIDINADWQLTSRADFGLFDDSGLGLDNLVLDFA